MTAKILCPWCGAEMEEHLTYASGRGRKEYKCPKCSAKSPPEETREQARAAALRRYTPPIKPMTLEEAIDASAVWIELLTNEPENDLKPSLFGWRNEGRWVVFLERPGEDDDDGGKIVEYNPLDYGSTWRCWSRKPTDEERSAAEWET